MDSNSSYGTDLIDPAFAGMSLAEVCALARRLQTQVRHTEALNAKLTHEMAVLKRLKFAATSERFSAEQKSLLEEAIDEDLEALVCMATSASTTCCACELTPRSSCCWPPSTLWSALPTSEHSCSPGDSRAAGQDGVTGRSPSSSNRQSNNPSSCPKKLDQHTSLRARSPRAASWRACRSLPCLSMPGA